MMMKQREKEKKVIRNCNKHSFLKCRDKFYGWIKMQLCDEKKKNYVKAN